MPGRERGDGTVGGGEGCWWHAFLCYENKEKQREGKRERKCRELRGEGMGGDVGRKGGGSGGGGESGREESGTVHKIGEETTQYR